MLMQNKKGSRENSKKRKEESMLGKLVCLRQVEKESFLTLSFL